MLERYNIAGVARAHYRAMKRPGTTNSFDWPALIITIAVPLVVGAGGFVAGWRISTPTLVSPLLTVSAFIVGGMLTLFVFLANLRVKISETATLQKRRHLASLVSEVSASCLYTATLTFVLGVGSVMLASYSTGWPGPVHSALVGLAAAVYIHVSLTLLTVIRRLFAVYEDLFRRDFIVIVAPDETADPLPPRHKKRRANR